jgi:hypothetical protein
VKSGARRGDTRHCSTSLDSPQRVVARADRANFPMFVGNVRHQVVEILDIPRVPAS